jgi:DNA polymerase III gamma/tau subunit
MSETIITKYRPTSFDEMVGHEAIRRALADAVLGGTAPHAYLMTGPGGIGKTTTARILANMLECEVLEIDAASNSGVEEARQIAELGNHMSLTGAGRRMIIVDECFAPGTRVNTPTGFSFIESLKPGDFILGAKGAKRIKRTIINSVPLSRIMELRLANGVSIRVSEDHAFLSNTGWVMAKDTPHVESISTIYAYLPNKMQEMWDELYEQGRGRALLQRLFSAHLSRMRQPLLEQCERMLKNMRLRYSSSEKRRAAFGASESIHAHSAAALKRIRRWAQESCSVFAAHAVLQSYEKPSHNFKNDGDQTQKWNFDSGQTLARREWTRAFEAAVDAELSDRWFDGVCNPNAESSKRGALSARLQNRYSDTIQKTSNRGGWGKPSISDAKGFGRQEGSSPASIRVEGSSRLQPGDIARLRDSGQTHFANGVECAYFYDLEIEDHPSYGVENLIVHNCHTLSKQAWQALLKVLEEPPSHLYFSLCTTELAKVPDTIVQRCYHVPLKPVSTEEMEELLLAICEMEEWEPDPDVLTLVIQAATGQPRKALSMLQAVHKAPSKEEAARIITLQEMSTPLIELCKLLVKGPTWDTIKPLLLAIQDEEWKDASLLAGRWLAKAMVMARTEANATRIWVMLDALTFPVDTFDRKIAFYAALGKMLWGENQIGAPEPAPPGTKPLKSGWWSEHSDDEIPF